MNRIKSPCILTFFLLITTQVSFGQIIDPDKPSESLDSLNKSLQLLDTLFCHDENGKLVKYQDEFSSISFSNGQFVQLKIGDFELNSTTDSYQVIAYDNNKKAYRFISEPLDIKIELPEDSVISLLKESKNYGKANIPFHRINGYKVTFDEIINLNNLKISPELDTSLYDIRSAWIHNESTISINMGKLLDDNSKFGAFTIFRADNYNIAVFTNRKGVIDYIGIKSKEKFYLWFNFKKKLKSETLSNIEYVLTIDQGQNSHPLFVGYSLMSYKKNGKMKANRVPILRCIGE